MENSEENRREDVKEREARDDGDVSLFTIVKCETLLQIDFVSFKNGNFLKFKIVIGLKSS